MLDLMALPETAVWLHFTLWIMSAAPVSVLGAQRAHGSNEQQGGLEDIDMGH